MKSVHGKRSRAMRSQNWDGHEYCNYAKHGPLTPSRLLCFLFSRTKIWLQIIARPRQNCPWLSKISECMTALFHIFNTFTPPPASLIWPGWQSEKYANFIKSKRPRATTFNLRLYLRTRCKCSF